MSVISLLSTRLGDTRLSSAGRLSISSRRCGARWELREVGDNTVNRRKVEVELDADGVGYQLLGFVVRSRGHAFKNSALALEQDLKLRQDPRLCRSVMHSRIYFVERSYPGSFHGIAESQRERK